MMDTLIRDDVIRGQRGWGREDEVIGELGDR